MNIIDAIKKEFPGIDTQLLEILGKELPAHGITGPLREAAFVAQVGAECGFVIREESTNYSSVDRILAVFPTHFKSRVDAQNYVRQPIRLANRVYANRMGNGNEQSGDGARYKGRGLIQLTGRENYAACGKAIGKNLLAYPELLLTPQNTVLSALWFWNKNRCNELADKPDFIGLTKRINGGLNGLDKRKELYTGFLDLLAE